MKHRQKNMGYKVRVMCQYWKVDVTWKRVRELNFISPFSPTPHFSFSFVQDSQPDTVWNMTGVQKCWKLQVCAINQRSLDLPLKNPEGIWKALPPAVESNSQTAKEMFYNQFHPMRPAPSLPPHLCSWDPPASLNIKMRNEAWCVCRESCQAKC